MTLRFYGSISPHMIELFQNYNKLVLRIASEIGNQKKARHSQCRAFYLKVKTGIVSDCNL